MDTISYRGSFCSNYLCNFVHYQAIALDFILSPNETRQFHKYFLNVSLLFRVNVIGPDGRIVRHSIFDGQNGTYKVIWKPSVVGEHLIHVTLKDIHIQQSPFRVRL